MNTVIEASGVNFSYDHINRVLTDVSFEVYEHDFVGLIGPNGGGKSTLFKIILGLLKPDSGTLKVFDKESCKARDRIGYVPQYSNIDLNYPISAWEVVLSGLLGKKRMGSTYSKADKEAARKTLEDLTLLQFKDRAIGELSGGQRQRIMIARALVRDPKILLLDEPTNSVDEDSGRDLYELLHVLNKKMAIVIVSHDVDTISSSVKRIFCLNNSLICNCADDIATEDTGDGRKIIHHSDHCIIH
jgi:zinc transport system ATP-binding protein